MRQLLFHFEIFSTLHISTASFFLFFCQVMTFKKKRRSIKIEEHKNCLLWCYRKCFREKFFIQTIPFEFGVFSRSSQMLPIQLNSFNHFVGTLKRERCDSSRCRLSMYIDETGEKYIIATFALKADTNFSCFYLSIYTSVLPLIP